MVEVGSTAVVKAILMDNAKLKMELQESQGSVSKLKAMLKQSRLRIKELEAEKYERKVEEEIEKELIQFQVKIPSKTAVKQENIDSNLLLTDPVPSQGNDVVSELDSFINRMNKTNKAEKLQEEELLAEDLQVRETVEATFTFNRDNIIKTEKEIETSSSAKSKPQKFVKDLDKNWPWLIQM